MVRDEIEVYVPSTPIAPARRCSTIVQLGFGEAEPDWVVTSDCRRHLELA